MDGISEVGRNGGWDRFISAIAFFAVIGTPHGDPLIDGFVGLERAEARLVKRES